MIFRRKPQRPRPVRSAGPSVPVGPLFVASCAVDPADRLRVRAQRNGQRPFVTVGVQSATDFDFVVLTPGNARRVAAAILNSADEVDGIKPLFTEQEIDPR